MEIFKGQEKLGLEKCENNLWQTRNADTGHEKEYIQLFSSSCESGFGKFDQEDKNSQNRLT